MKKNIFIIAVMLFFIPIVVLADIGAEYHTSVFDNNGDLGYIVRYSTTFGMSEGGVSTSYIKYDSNILQYSSVKEYESKTEAETKVVSVEPGVIKLTITSVKHFDEYDVNVLLAFNFKDQKVPTKIELIPEYEYENLECEDCDGFWMGSIDNQNKIRTIEISNDGTIIKNGDKANIVIDNESEDLTNNPSEGEESLEKSNTEDSKQANYITIIGILSGIIITLIILLIYFVRKSKHSTVS